MNLSNTISIFLLLTSTHLIAQDKKIQKPPSILGRKTINYNKNVVSISNYRGKLLIIDFWASWCAPCRSSLPKLEAIQKKFKNEISIIPVTYESKLIAKKCFDQLNISLPSIVEDTVLQNIFPHHFIPHEVWIDEKGNVITQTDEDAVNEDNIIAYLNTKKINAKEKKDLNFDGDKPLFVDGNGGSGEKFIYRSIFTEEIDGLGSKILCNRKNDNDGISRVNTINFLNLTLFYMFSAAFNMCKPPLLPELSRILIEYKDSIYQPLEYYTNGYTLNLPDFNDKLLFCYNLSLQNSGLPDSTFFRSNVIDDLNKMSNINARIEKRKTTVWVINKIADSTNILQVKDDNDETKYNYNDYNQSTIKDISNITLKSFLSWIKLAYPASPIIINETGYSNEKLNISLNIDYKKNNNNLKPLDILEWRNVFKKYGMDIKKDFRTEEILILKISTQQYR